MRTLWDALNEIEDFEAGRGGNIPFGRCSGFLLRQCWRAPTI